MWHHHNAFGCQKLCSNMLSAVALWNSGAPSWHKYFSSPNPQSVSNEKFPDSCSLHQHSFWLLIYHRIEQVLLPVLYCHQSILLMVVCCAAHFNKGSAFRKYFMPAKGVCSSYYMISKGLLKISMCCGGNVTEFNTQKWHTYRCVIFHASISMTRFTNKSWHFKHLLHTEALQSHANVSGDEGRTKVKGCLC